MSKEPLPREELHSSALSISSTSSTLYNTPTNTTTPFHPTKRFTIHAQGIGLVRLPFPSREMETPIYHTEDGSLAYTSTRDKRCSGNAILSHPKLGDIVQTEYFFGPGRDPVIRILQTEQGPFEVTVKGKWASRTRRFEIRNGECFEWSYASEKTSGKRVNLIVLRRVDGDGEKDREGRIIAQLVRSEEKRTAGTSRSRAGNGGELLVSEEGIRDVGEGLIIATCLSMLKREIDRRRAVQAAVIAGGAGS